MRELKIGTSWVRGVVGDALTPDLVLNFACAFGTWGGGGAVIVGRDTRQSSPMLHSAVLSGLMSQGCEIIDLGVCPTPVISFAVRELGAAGGLSITGSHNSSRWNALKFIGADGALLNPVKSEELLDIYHAAAFKNVSFEHLKPVDDSVEATSLIDRYFEYLLAALDVKPIRKRAFRVAIDFCNGSGATVMSRFLKELGCTLLPLNDDPSSQFAHDPSPSIANMRQLVGAMVNLDADLGAVINIDGDRIGFITSEGVPLSEEYTLPLAAMSRFSRRPGPVVTNLSTSRMIDTLARQYGQRVIRTSVGEGYVIDRGLEEGAVLAGEGNGGVGALPTTMTFDAMLTLAMVLESMATQDLSPGEVSQQLPKFIMRKGELACPPDQVYRVLEEFRTTYSDTKPDVTDGVRAEWDDAWIHVRASNTEPLLRIIVEAESESRANHLFEDAEARSRRTFQGRRKI